MHDINHEKRRLSVLAMNFDLAGAFAGAFAGALAVLRKNYAQLLAYYAGTE